MKNFEISLLAALFILTSCENDKQDGGDNQEIEVNEDVASFKETGTITVGGLAAAEISAYDETTKRLKRLFTVNNSGTNQIDVIDLTEPTNPIKLIPINLSVYNGASNSVVVYGWKLASSLIIDYQQTRERKSSGFQYFGL